MSNPKFSVGEPVRVIGQDKLWRVLEIRTKDRTTGLDLPATSYLLEDPQYRAIDARRVVFEGEIASAVAESKICGTTHGGPDWHCTRHAGHEGPCAAVPARNGVPVTVDASTAELERACQEIVHLRCQLASARLVLGSFASTKAVITEHDSDETLAHCVVRVGLLRAARTLEAQWAAQDEQKR